MFTRITKSAAETARLAQMVGKKLHEGTVVCLDGDLGAGKTLVGVNANDVDFNAAEKTGGEKAHALSAGELPSHTHGSASLTGTMQSVMFDDADTISITGICSATTPRQRSWTGTSGNAVRNVTIDASHEHAAVGSNEAHNNLQPYITCYFWKRTA